jgi:hypothetical protein
VPPSRRVPYPVAAIIAIVVLLVGVAWLVVGDDGDDEASDRASSPSTTAPATSTTQAVITTTGPSCTELDAPGDVDDRLDITADVDGDGADDEVTSFRVPGSDTLYQLQVAFAAGGGAVTTVDGDGVVTAGVLGGADIDGDGGEELWVRTTAGASATILGIVRRDGCDLTRVSAPSGQPIALPIGGSVGSPSGIECEGDVAPEADLTTFAASSIDGVEYEVLATEHDLDGATLVELTTTAGSVSASDPDFIRYASLTCGDLRL